MHEIFCHYYFKLKSLSLKKSLLIPHFKKNCIFEAVITLSNEEDYISYFDGYTFFVKSKSLAT